MLRKNHSGMETWVCRRGAWGRAPGLRKNHSGMETVIGGGYYFLLVLLRKNHSGMETVSKKKGALRRLVVA